MLVGWPWLLSWTKSFGGTKQQNIINKNIIIIYISHSTDTMSDYQHCKNKIYIEREYKMVVKIFMIFKRLFVTEAVVKKFLNNYFVLKSVCYLGKNAKEKMRATDIVLFLLYFLALLTGLICYSHLFFFLLINDLKCYFYHLFVPPLIKMGLICIGNLL